jgi:hypothetical protein
MSCLIASTNKTPKAIKIPYQNKIYIGFEYPKEALSVYKIIKNQSLILEQNISNLNSIMIHYSHTTGKGVYVEFWYQFQPV